MILRPGKNVWRLESANRVSVLIDGADYFQALRESMLHATRSIFIVGWDIHSQTRLVGKSGKAEDGYPEYFGEFLTSLAKRRPELKIYLLLWDYAMLYAGQRELFPTYTFRWNTPPQVFFCLDNAVPVGSSQHQKLIIIDDAIAFSGGLDVTVRRWDTSEHIIDNPHRLDPSGEPYPPFHDVQMLVDGDAALALARIVRDRWAEANHEEPPPVQSLGDPWPATAEPDFSEVDVGIARTYPQYLDRQGIQEVEALHCDAIASAERSIYIENQFVTCRRIAQQLIARLEERLDLEAVIIVPDRPETWLEQHSMRYGRFQFLAALKRSRAAERVEMLAPSVASNDRSVATMVHSKLMIVDDKLLRIGSANLNNRSMSVDTECDLAIEGKNEAIRSSIANVRDRLLADHCGVTVSEVRAALKEGSSLLSAAKKLTGRGHRLLTLNCPTGLTDGGSPLLLGVADPERPIGAEEFVAKILGGHVSASHVRAIAKLCAVGVVVLLLALVWHLTPLATWTDPAMLRQGLSWLSHGYWSPVVAIAAYLVGGIVLFPVTVLIAVTAAAFGPWLGFLIAALGSVLSAVLTYAIGALVGKNSLREVLGPRLNRILAHVRRSGLLAVVSLRLVPVAPFTVVNLVAGAGDVRFRDFLLGTVIGLLPGLVALTLLGQQLSALLLNPSALQLALVAAFVVFWIAFTIGIQVLLNRFGSRVE